MTKLCRAMHIYRGWHGTQISRFGTYLDSGVTVLFDFVQQLKEEIYFTTFNLF